MCSSLASEKPDMRFSICVMADVDEMGFFSHAEALGYEGQLQITISPATLCLLQASSPCKK